MVAEDPEARELVLQSIDTVLYFYIINSFHIPCKFLFQRIYTIPILFKCTFMFQRVYLIEEGGWAGDGNLLFHFCRPSPLSEGNDLANAVVID